MQDALTIRTATEDDTAEIDALLGRSYPKLLQPDYPPSVLVTALPLISRAQPQLIRSGSYFVAVRGGVILGAGGWSMESEFRRRGTGRVASVRHVVTDADCTRQGVATRLFHHIFETTRQAGVISLDCMSTRTAVPFYRAMGFDVIGEHDLELRPGISFPAIRMQRML
ncbi:MAG: GNAT family N-acetyltransferase [Rhodobacteraceae bacterium]|nr:GNAT family N-acetyltransferase [Paracoccaceae bacterium]